MRFFLALIFLLTISVTSWAQPGDPPPPDPGPPVPIEGLFFIVAAGGALGLKNLLGKKKDN